MRVSRLTCVALLLGVAVLAGCRMAPADGAEQTAPAAAPHQVFRSSTYDLWLVYPRAGVQRRSGSGGYFDNQAWRADAGPHDQGQRLLVLRLDRSNRVTSAELRIGVSRAARQVSNCTRPGNLARLQETAPVELAGVLFTTYRGGDAGMSHYQHVRAYRAVHDDTCYAIDLVVEGTNPEVYDPPRTPPFSQKQAFQRLRALLGGLSFPSSGG